MGKPWRKKDRQPAVDISSDYKWSSQSYTLKGILSNFKLPVVVQCREETNPHHLQNFFFDLRQPVLLHSKRTSRKVFARCIRKGEGGTVKELLPEVVIPEDYAGWFKVSKGLQFDKPTPHRSIASVIEADTDFFLCTTEFNGVVITESMSSNSDSAGTESIIRPVMEGEVLRKIGVEKLNQLLLPEPLRSQMIDNRFLLCIDEKDTEVFIPFGQSGLFYEVSDGNLDKSTNNVLQISDILDEMIELPIHVRHILGDPPPISKFYSPCLKLVRIKEEEAVMGSTLDTEEDALPLEIQTSSTIKFEIALNTPMLQSCAEYMEAVDMCNNMGQSYVTDMKLAVTFQVKPESPEEKPKQAQVYSNPSFPVDDNENLDSITNSQTSTSLGKESELGDDIDANSEFSIDWDVNKMSGLKGPNMDPLSNMPEPDSVSIDSVDTIQAKKLNTVLGGSYFDDVGRKKSEGSPATNTEVRPAPVPAISVSSAPPGNPVYPLSNRLSNEQALLLKIREMQNHRNDLSSNSSLESWRRNSSSDITRPSVVSRLGRPHIITAKSPELTPFTDVVEEITDFSVNSMLTADSSSGPSTSTAILRPPSPFTDGLESLPSTVSKVHSSSTSTLASSTRSQIDLSDHFPSIHSSTSNISIEVELSPESMRGDCTFTGDVFISPDIEHESVGSNMSSCRSSNQSIDGSYESWGNNKYRVIRSRDLPPQDQRHFVNDLMDNQHVYRTSSLTDDLIKFEEASRTSSTNDILTCKVADEMVSSCNDLRLSLEEITKNARDSHTESSWKQFCLERSSSLPVRSKNKTTPQGIRHTDEHSQSWEEISPRVNGDNSNASTPRNLPTNLTNGLYKGNLAFTDECADDTQLILNTSSEDSVQFSRGSVDSMCNEHNTSFAMSETSDMSVTDGPESVLAAIAEMDYVLGDLTSDTASNSSRRSNSRSVIAQRLKIENEIRKKQLPDWNDVVEVI